ncbi:MAG: XRE family transcriptional regulator [Magnetococcales bacterium]|nr:XRE family transcriptional regulator [Magnetococcales bacterium]MBF0114175.1 XRE family transcriptional regulator [Magnetococcales bacterium]
MITESSGNVFLDLGFSPEDAKVLAMRADLMGSLRLLIQERGLTQTEAAKMFGVKQSRVSDLVRGKFARFTLDTLIAFAVRAGVHVELRLAA